MKLCMILSLGGGFLKKKARVFGGHQEEMKP